MIVNSTKKYTFKIISSESVHLHPFITSSIRGAIGTELIKRHCIHKSNINCGECKKRNTCSAGIVFESSNSKNASNITAPYIFYAPIKKRDSVNAITFDLTLFGNGLYAFKDIIEILDEGIYLTPEKHKFRLNALKVYDISDLQQNINSNATKINFISPYKYKVTNQPLTFEYIIRGMLRRTLNIHKLCGEELTMDYKDLINQAKKIAIIDNDLTLVNYDRYSNRTNSKMKVCGKVGCITLDSNLAKYLPLMKTVQIYHLGKLTTMGLGKIEIL